MGEGGMGGGGMGGGRMGGGGMGRKRNGRRRRYGGGGGGWRDGLALRALVALTEDPSAHPSVTSVAEDLMSSGLHRYLVHAVNIHAGKTPTHMK